MAEYIERKKVEEAFDNADPDVCESYPDGYSDWGFGRKNVRDVIRGVPAADVVEVTRCKDCKYSKKLFSYEGSYSSYCLICGSKGSVVFPNDFCSCGERKSG